MKLWTVKLVLIVLGVLLVMLMAGSGAFVFLLSDRIYPGVAVLGVDVGGLTVTEATRVLQKRLPDPPSLQVTAAGQQWTFGPEVTGRDYDPAGSAYRAYMVGRQGSFFEQAQVILGALVSGTETQPKLLAVDSLKVRAELKAIAGTLFIAPTDGRLDLSEGQLKVVPGVDGRRLDIATAAREVETALADGVETVELTLEPVQPKIVMPEPAAGLAQKLLAQPFRLITDDPLTSYQGEFGTTPEQIAGWLRPRPAGSSVELLFDRAAVRSWLETISTELGPERILNITETEMLVLTALATGQPELQPRIYHPERHYIVQPGDMLSGISYLYGMPMWRIEEANPQLISRTVDVGMDLVIPSIDVLFPHPLVPGKRIEIDLAKQQLRAFENEQMVMELKISSGMSSTPTLDGQFQILMKEKDAFARRWQLDMPYFMGFYLEGPDFYNGIHELPVTAWGSRLSEGVLGWPASFGCIIVNTGDAERLFNWAPVGTLVTVTGVAPGTPAAGGTLDTLVGTEAGASVPGAPTTPN